MGYNYVFNFYQFSIREYTNLLHKYTNSVYLSVMNISLLVHENILSHPYLPTL